MAWAFELQVDFDDPGAGDPFFDYINERLKPVTLGDKTVGIHPARGTFANPDGHPALTVSIYPKGVGWGISFDKEEDLVKLDSDELYKLSLHLYECLKGAPQYRGAIVGWEVTGIDPIEYAKEGTVIEGLVAHNDYKAYFGDEWRPFDDDHHWIPLTEMDAL